MTNRIPRAVVTMAAILAILLWLPGCMPESRSGKVYTRDQARSSHSVTYGTILRVEEVTIEGTQSGAGALAGGAVGGVLGRGVGGGSGRAMATVGGAVVGALAGAAVEKGVTSDLGVELEVQLENGEVIVVVQEQDALYRIGDRVRVLRDARGVTRVRQ